LPLFIKFQGELLNGDVKYTTVGILRDFRPKSPFTSETVGDNNNNNNHDDIYSAVIMTEVIARVHSVHLVNVEQRQAATDP